MPANMWVMFMGSKTVAFDGLPASHMIDPTLDCQSIGFPPIPRLRKKPTKLTLFLPTGVVLPIPAGRPVLIGGPPTISLMVLGMQLALAGLGKGLGRLAKTKMGQRLGAAARKRLPKLPRKPKGMRTTPQRGVWQGR